MKFALPATLLVFSLCGTASAQTTAEGTIRGVIHDDQGGVLPGVTVVATSPTVAGTFTSVSDAVGAYRLLNLSPGEYSVTAELQGFSKYVRPGIVVRAGLNIAVDIEMKVGAVSETVQVTADSPMLEVQKPVQAVNISGDLQRALPLGTRKDFSEFLEVTPGVTARTFDQGTGGQVYMLRGGAARRRRGHQHRDAVWDEYAQGRRVRDLSGEELERQQRGGRRSERLQQ